MDGMVKDYLSHHGIKGQKWGVRRYQNKDGSLTKEGENRYERDKRENLAKKKDNRIDTSNPDPNRWVKEDMTRSENLVNSSNKMVNQLSDLEKKTRPKMDLSQMSDQELREQVNRRILEQNYERLFSDENPDTVSKGRRHVKETLEVAGTVLGLTSTALSIAKSIQELRS